MISIVTALYKSDYYLPAYLKALRKFVAELQKRRVAFEVIFVPQKSNEKEKELLKTVSGQSWCRIIENPTPSLYMAWNTGASNARGDVIGFWNVDDIRFWPAVVEAEALVKAGADVVYFPFIIHRHLRMGPLDIVVAFKKIQGKAIEFEKRKFEISFPAGPHFMFSKKAYQAVGPFDEQFRARARGRGRRRVRLVTGCSPRVAVGCHRAQPGALNGATRHWRARRSTFARESSRARRGAARSRRAAVDGCRGPGG